MNKVNSLEYSKFLIRDIIGIVDNNEKIAFNADQFKDSVIEVVHTAQSLIRQAHDRSSSQSDWPLEENDIVSKIERLASLFEKGLLTQEEFNQQKINYFVIKTL